MNSVLFFILVFINPRQRYHEMTWSNCSHALKGRELTILSSYFFTLHDSKQKLPMHMLFTLHKLLCSLWHSQNCLRSAGEKAGECAGLCSQESWMREGGPEVWEGSWEGRCRNKAPHSLHFFIMTGVISLQQTKLGSWSSWKIITSVIFLCSNIFIYL